MRILQRSQEFDQLFFHLIRVFAKVFLTGQKLSANFDFINYTLNAEKVLTVFSKTHVLY